MKRIITVLCIAIGMLALIIAEQIFVDNTLNTMIDKINLLSTSVASTENVNTQQLNNMIADIDNYWMEREQWLCLSINHNELSKMGEQIQKVKVYIEQNKKDECVYEVDVLSFYAQSYKHVLQLNLQNIF